MYSWIQKAPIPTFVNIQNFIFPSPSRALSLLRIDFKQLVALGIFISFLLDCDKKSQQQKQYL